MLRPLFLATGHHFSPAHWRALLCRRARVASAPRGLRSSTRPLGCHFSPTQQPAGALSRADGIMSALTTMRPRSPTRRTLPLASRPDYWLSSVSTCIAFRIARSVRLTVHGCHHAHIKVMSTGIKPACTHYCVHWYQTIRKCPWSLIHSYAMGAFSFCVGRAPLPALQAPFREGSSLALTVLWAGKPSVAFAHRDILTPAVYMPTVFIMSITRSGLPTSSARTR